MELGIRIKERLDVLEITQSELGRRAKVAQSTINSLIKKPRRSSPHLIKIAQALQTTPAYLTGDSDDPGCDMPLADGLTSEERDWVDLLRSIAPKDRSAALQLVRTIANSAASPMLQGHKLDFRGQ